MGTSGSVPDPWVLQETLSLYPVDAMEEVEPTICICKVQWSSSILHFYSSKSVDRKLQLVFSYDTFLYLAAEYMECGHFSATFIASDEKLKTVC